MQLDDTLPQLPSRDPESHKGTFGRVLLIGGSTGMAGSISLSALAALRSGAGLVTVAVPEPVLATVAAFHPAYMTLPLPADDDGRIASGALNTVNQVIDAFDVVAVGPGLGRSNEVTQVVQQLYADYPQAMVIDADGLNALAHADLTKMKAAGPRVLTPHPGEFARLTGNRLGDDSDARVKSASKFAASIGAVVLLKGHQTVITNGDRYALNATGNAGMATGGTGDVLTGIIAALLGQGLDGWSAARLGAHVHGLSGDLAKDKFGEVSLIATDLIDHLPAAFLQCGK